ncbi:hypothetical protein B4110_1869 [Parageobacillus toebii]|uniref:Uncharacterized protein n=2 Tax=Parageobacillus toebii TaxID=153151 RepID=A0A150MEP7_9BACL|nr:hypothetical protein B4110_1869 [Parageobacillus toebii]
MFPNLRGIAKRGKMMKHQAKGLSLLSQKLEENFSLNYSFTQSLRQEIKSNIMKENGPDWGEEKEGQC